MNGFIKKYRYELLVLFLILLVCTIHILFLLQLDFVGNPGDYWYVGRQAIEGYWLLEDGHWKDFFVNVFECSDNKPRYPNFTGFLLALPCYFFGLNDVVMRSTMLVLYCIMLVYTFLCGKELYSKKIGLFAVLIAATMPVVVFWSRTIMYTFVSATFFIMAFYHVVRSKNFQHFGHSLLFGLLSGCALLPHRIMFIYITILWVTVFIFYIITRPQNKKSPISFISALSVFVLISSNFILTWVRYGEPNRLLFYLSYNERVIKYINLLSELQYLITWDNLIIIILVAGLFVFRKKQREDGKKNGTSLLYWVTGISLYLLSILVIVHDDFVFAYSDYFVPVALLLALCIAYYLSRLPVWMQSIFIIKKVLLLVYLLVVMIPHENMPSVVNIFHNYFSKYYANRCRDNDGIMWSNTTYARQEEFDYFRHEIEYGDIIVVDISENQPLPLGSRLEINGIGRRINVSKATLTACYVMFYCLPVHNYDYENNSERQTAETNTPEALVFVEDVLNDNARSNAQEKICLEEGYEYIEDVVHYFSTYNFIKTKIFTYHYENTPHYKVVFKCTDNVSELVDFFGFDAEIYGRGREPFILTDIK